MLTPSLPLWPSRGSPLQQPGSAAALRGDGGLAAEDAGGEGVPELPLPGGEGPGGETGPGEPLPARAGERTQLLQPELQLLSD